MEIADKVVSVICFIIPDGDISYLNTGQDTFQKHYSTYSGIRLFSSWCVAREFHTRKYLAIDMDVVSSGRSASTRSIWSPEVKEFDSEEAALMYAVIMNGCER